MSSDDIKFPLVYGEGKRVSRHLNFALSGRDIVDSKICLVFFSHCKLNVILKLIM